MNKDKNRKDRFVRLGILKSGKEWFVIGEKQAREIIKKYNIKVDKQLFKMASLDISLIKYKGEDVCIWFTPQDDNDAKRFDISTKKKEMGMAESLMYGLNKIIFNKYKMNGVDCGEILSNIYG